MTENMTFGLDVVFIAMAATMTVAMFIYWTVWAAITDAWGRYDYVVVVAAVLCLVDGLMTLPYWHLEGNPVVLMLGPDGMMIVKTLAVGGFLGLWFTWDGVSDSSIARACAVGVCSLYVLVVTTNVIVLLL